MAPKIVGKSGTRTSVSRNPKTQPGKGDGTEPLRQNLGSNRLSDNFPSARQPNKTSRTRSAMEGRLGSNKGKTRTSTHTTRNESTRTAATRNTSAGRIRKTRKD